MKRIGKMSIAILAMIVSLILLILGLGVKDADVLMASVLILFVSVFLYSIFEGKKNIVFTAFLICFFTFILGEWGIKYLMGQEWKQMFDNKVIRHVLICVYLSLFAIFWGVLCGNSKSKEKTMTDIELYKQENKKYENVVLILFYITVAFNLAAVLEKVIFVQTSTYIELYRTYSNTLPGMVYKLAECNDFMLYALMTMLPDKKKAKLPLIIYFAIGLLSLLTGIRGTAVKVTILLIIYCLFRNTTDEEPWVKRKHVILISIAAPLAIVFLSLYNSWRSGLTANYTGFWTEFLNFFTTQGGSINVIAYEKVFHEMLPKTNTSYFFGPIIALYKHGFIGKIIGSIFNQEFVEYAKNTVGDALYGNNLGATITYLVMPQYFLSGVGLGTQYIAEAYADFGYVGVTIFNFILGFLLSKCKFVYFKKWYWNVFIIYMIYSFLGIARNFALGFVPIWISVWNWALVAAILLLGKVRLKKYGGINDEGTVDM